jgi:outer membrane receptor protein involved in Fe transport
MINASITNLFDEFYYDHATYAYSPRAGGNIGYPSKGMEFVLSASYGF